ncbi:MAG: type III-A CRISPR-associated RAMP protein Csm5, partial [Desulfobacterales bacterium]|nr:type III-A CRISPR-associated RAMP protein Csm5 [Desulfobacterales bacterium]
MKPSRDKKEVYSCLIRTLAPLHVGCDEVYEPTGFVVDEAAGRMVVFDPLIFLAQLEQGDRDKFSQICLKGTIASILETYKFLKGRRAGGRSVAMCRGLLEHYGKTLAMPLHDERRIRQELNNFTIARTAFNAVDNRPYIPGSAIKGSLRTAYLNHRAGKKRVSPKSGRRAAKDLEKDLLDGGAFQTDPFRLVKVSDFKPVGRIEAKVMYAVNEKKVPSKFQARGPYQILEVVQPGALFQGEIIVEPPPPGSGVKAPISLEKLLNGAEKFYAGEKSREGEDLGRSSIPDQTPARDEAGVLVRLGRHSGAESVTIKGHRDIRIMMGRGKQAKFKDHATTFWLASESSHKGNKRDLNPFGWAEITPLAPGQSAEIKETKRQWRKKEKNEITQRARAQQEAAEAELKREREEKEKREAEERRKAELAAMTDEQRDIAAISEPGVTENKVVETYNRIDDFPDAEKINLARALKEYWEKNNKWTKKKCTKKQWKKV